MQTTSRDDSMMSDFFQVGGHSNFGGIMKRMKERKDIAIAKAKENKRKQALEIKRLIEEEERIEQEIINEQNVLKNQVVDTPTPQPKANKTPYLWIGLGAVVLVGVTILIVKKS
jgi:hypothetical protein|eukprot:SAG31_NODE_355_length_17187_cov_15.601299_24_plen_114_part_00